MAWFRVIDLSEAGLILAGFISGIIDSIAGGGGLITIPALSLYLGVGADAIGTNKIAALLGTLVSFGVYARHGKAPWKLTIIFSLTVGLASYLGSLITPFFPLWVFPWLLVITCPIILFIIWKKDWWLDAKTSARSSSITVLVFSAFLCGFYDGLWGPGGGTFMLLSLVLLAKWPLIDALMASKLANAMSALFALVGYAQTGHVQVKPGLILAIGLVVGSFLGAKFATKRAAQIVRPMLALVVSILVIQVVWEFFR